MAGFQTVMRHLTQLMREHNVLFLPRYFYIVCQFEFFCSLLQSIVSIYGGPKIWHTFVYALTSYALTLSNIDRFSNFRIRRKCVIIQSLKIPPHPTLFPIVNVLKCVVAHNPFQEINDRKQRVYCLRYYLK